MVEDADRTQSLQEIISIMPQHLHPLLATKDTFTPRLDEA